MARLRGRAPKGERLRAGIPQGHWKTTTFAAGLRSTCITAQVNARRADEPRRPPRLCPCSPPATSSSWTTLRPRGQGSPRRHRGRGRLPALAAALSCRPSWVARTITLPRGTSDFVRAHQLPSPAITYLRSGGPALPLNPALGAVSGRPPGRRCSLSAVAPKLSLPLLRLEDRRPTPSVHSAKIDIEQRILSKVPSSILGKR